MKCNVGKSDRIFRAIVGIAIILFGIVYQSWLGLIGLIPVLTAVFGFCPLYVPFKINTIGKTEASNE